MRVEKDIGITESFIIYEGPTPLGRGTLDPITVILRDFGGSGQIIVECYGSAWSHWFGAIGDKSLKRFLAGCNPGYLADKLLSNTAQPFNQRTQSWVERIVFAIHQAINKGVA